MVIAQMKIHNGINGVDIYTADYMYIFYKHKAEAWYDKYGELIDKQHKIIKWAKESELLNV
jgi:hypothetical protein